MNLEIIAYVSLSVAAPIAVGELLRITHARAKELLKEQFEAVFAILDKEVAAQVVAVPPGDIDSHLVRFALSSVPWWAYPAFLSRGARVRLQDAAWEYLHECNMREIEKLANIKLASTRKYSARQTP